ncbi:MAG TPA: sigma-70 family RNA polymerase sigma factor [Terriglobales bacterium]|nr:sigma-70 family RNA polymerase sigma factor [Terriglobales bacterium]
MSTALTTALRAGQEESAVPVAASDFDRVIREHQQRVFRVLVLLVRDSDAADTLTQECFLRAYQNLNGFRGDCALGTWLLRIAVNLAKDYGKNRRTSFWRRLIGLDDTKDRNGTPIQWRSDGPSPERVLLAREQARAVWSAVDLLPPRQRTVFLLRFSEEMALAEIAEIMGLRVGSVKAQLSRATGSIRKQLREQQWR